VKHSLTAEHIHQLAQHTQGFVGADLAALVNEAALAALRRHVTALQQQPPPKLQQQQLQQQQLQQQRAAGLCVCWQDFEAARLLVRPSALREVAIEVPQVSLCLK
jgi:transitional endoplasmic reticulum ATPase